MQTLPVNPHSTSAKPTIIGGMDQKEIDAELMKGIKSLENAEIYTVNEIDELLKQKFDI